LLISAAEYPALKHNVRVDIGFVEGKDYNRSIVPLHEAGVLGCTCPITYWAFYSNKRLLQKLKILLMWINMK